ncbi:MAG: NAD(P)H-dependent flavin oxidoreductase [Promethearchaeota archaeon]
MIWTTRITEMTKTKYPLIMGAFSRWSTIEFAAAFSNAGGLGIFTALNTNIDNFRNELQKMKELTDFPFGINISVFHDSKRTKEDYLHYVEIALDEGVEIFTTSAYQAPFIGEKVHESDCYWIPKVPLLKHALSAEKAGADAITLMGMESAGYKNRYQHTTLVNITVGKKILKVPLIAAGGIGNARGFLGALAMGAGAVCLGTAILSTKESPLEQRRKEKRLNTDITIKEYNMHYQGKGGFPSPSVAVLPKKIISMKSLLDGIMDEAESILKSWGFTKQEFNTINKIS